MLVNARRGDVRVELTTDGDSFAPVFSPAGDQIAYLHRDGLNIDLRVMTLEIDERGGITMVDDRPVTSDGGIDGASAPSWFIPADELAGAPPRSRPGPRDGRGDGRARGAFRRRRTAAATRIVASVGVAPGGC